MFPRNKILKYTGFAFVHCKTSVEVGVKLDSNISQLDEQLTTAYLLLLWEFYCPAQNNQGMELNSAIG